MVPKVQFKTLYDALDYMEKRPINPNTCKGVPPAVNALCKKIFKWMEVN